MYFFSSCPFILNSVMSVNHSLFGLVTVKSLSTILGSTFSCSPAFHEKYSFMTFFKFFCVF